MSIKSVWLDYRQLKSLRMQLEYVASDDLKEEFDDYLEANKGEGAYLINIFSNYSILELERLDGNVGIFQLIVRS